ncbi:MAG: FAD-dependent oxidoreductase [Lentisphaerae bacterium]|nr:FAD-dependent oxidoreductase [Lentisphaerota bacterium]
MVSIRANMQYDVAVIGGGVAGCAAALQAARSGAKTILIEKTIFPGGLATSGLVYIFLPICDGYGHKIIGGIAEEFLEDAMHYGPGAIPDGWDSPEPKGFRERYASKFSPASFVLRLDEKLQASGVDIWLDTLFCMPETDSQNRVCAIEVENKSGRIRIAAKCFVDASGDADVIRRAGGACMDCPNMLSIWAIEHDPAAKANFHNLADGLSRVVINMPIQAENPERFRGISGRQVSEFVLQSRELLRKRYQGTDCTSIFPLLLPSQADFRTTFFIRGKTILNGDAVPESCHDSIGVIGDWREPAPLMELPYSILLPEKLRGILAAGRCISVRGEAVEKVRVIPVAALTGQAAGAAAAIAAHRNITPDQVPVEDLQKTLRKCGVIIHRNEA